MKVHTASKDSFEKLAQSMGEMVEGMFQKNYVGFRPSKAWEPAINIYEQDDRLIVCVELAGMRREEIDVQVTPGQLTVRGARRDPVPPHSEGAGRLGLLEIRHGEFARTIELPEGLDVDNACAQYRNGYLWVHLPKAEA
jgi:HSP20 family protein